MSSTTFEASLKSARRAGSIRRRAKAWLPSAMLIALLAILILPPVSFLVYVSLTDDSSSHSTSFTLTHFARILNDPHLYSSLWNSVLFSATSSLLSIFYGGVLAWVVERTNSSFRPLAYLTVIVSLGTPYILYVAAWQFVLGRQGPLNEFYHLLSGTTDDLFDVYSMAGMVFIQGILWSPLVFLLLSATFRRANAEMEEAARICGASVVTTVSRISFRLAWPAIVGMSIFVFIRNLESFDVPILIGHPAGINLLTTDIFLSMTRIPPEMGHASAFSVALIVLLSIVFYFYGRYAQSADRFATVTGKGFRPRPFDMGRWRWVGGAIIVSNFVLVLVVPLAALLWNSFLPFISPMRSSALKLLSLDNYRVVLEESNYLDLAVNTIAVAAAAATAVMVITTVAGWFVVRRRPGGRIIEQLVTTPIVFPGTILGVALVIVGLHVPIPIYGTLTIIALAFVIRFMPYGMRYTHTGVLQIHHELEEAASVAGASQWLIFRRIVVPLLLPSLAAGWLFIFLIGANELSMSILLAGPRSQVMAVAMYEQWTNGQGVEVYAVGILWTLFMTACSVLFYLLARRTGGGISG